jgi:hypothetical protein
VGNIYNITVEGGIYAGNTIFPMPETSYRLWENFSREGFLAIERGFIAGNTQNTDQNQFETFLYAGTPLDSNVRAGEIQWASNNGLYAEFRSRTGVIDPRAGSAIDETSQSFDPTTNTLTITIPDATTALSTQLDLFNRQSNSPDASAAIVNGTIAIQFSDDRRTITGRASFYGNGNAESESVASLWNAEFSGTLNETYIGLGETNASDTFQPEPELGPGELNTPIYRFQNTNEPGTYIYVGEQERQNILANFPQFDEEGFTFKVGVTPGDDLLPMYRFQNTNIPGTYAYVGAQERQNIILNFPHFRDEGVAFYVYDSSANQGVDIYRFQNTAMLGTYIYVGEQERQNILANFPGFKEEGPAFEVVI